MPKTFDRVLHKALASKLPLHNFYSFLYIIISDFPLGCSVAVVTDGYCFSPTAINNGAPQGPVRLPTLFLLYTSDHLSCISCSFHSYTDDSILHYSTFFNDRPTEQQLTWSQDNVLTWLTFDQSPIFNRDRVHITTLGATKTNFILCTRHSLPNTSTFFSDTQFNFSSSHNSLGVFLSDLYGKFHICCQPKMSPRS